MNDLKQDFAFPRDAITVVDGVISPPEKKSGVSRKIIEGRRRDRRANLPTPKVIETTNPESILRFNGKIANIHAGRKEIRREELKFGSPAFSKASRLCEPSSSIEEEPRTMLDRLNTIRRNKAPLGWGTSKITTTEAVDRWERIQQKVNMRVERLRATHPEIACKIDQNIELSDSELMIAIGAQRIK